MAPMTSFASVKTTTTEASPATAFMPLAVTVSCRPRSHKVPPTDRGAHAIHHGWECVGIVVSVGFDTVSAVEVLCDRRDRHVCESGGNQEALGKVACRGCA